MPLFPAIYTDNKDALKNILNSIPKVTKKLSTEKRNKNDNDQQVGLSIPVDSSKKKGKSFSKEAEKLETKPNKNKTAAAKDKLANNHKSFGNLVHRRFTFGLKNRYKIINTAPGEVVRDHRNTFTKNLPPLIRFKTYTHNDGLGDSDKNYMERK